MMKVWILVLNCKKINYHPFFDYPLEYNEYYDEYSRSLDEDLCISPTTGKIFFLLFKFSLTKLFF